MLTNLHHPDRPQNVIQKAKAGQDQFAIAISDDSENLVGFSCLHLGKGPELCGFFGSTSSSINLQHIVKKFHYRK